MTAADALYAIIAEAATGKPVVTPSTIRASLVGLASDRSSNHTLNFLRQVFEDETFYEVRKNVGADCADIPNHFTEEKDQRLAIRYCLKHRWLITRDKLLPELRSIYDEYRPPSQVEAKTETKSEQKDIVRPPAGSPVLSLEGERACIICKEHGVNTVLEPCMHAQLCSICAQNPSIITCPLCRKAVIAIKLTY